MTTQTTTSLAPDAVLAAARDFFIGPDRMADAWIESESDSHVALCTFRGNLTISATADDEAPGQTLVRVSTLREEGLVPRLMTFIERREATVAGV